MITIDRPDPFLMMLYARRRVFVRIHDDEHLMIVALRQSVSISRLCGGEINSISAVWQTAESLGLFDGKGWNLVALATWVNRHCVVCWQPLVGRQTLYHSNSCKQKAYRERRR